MRYALVILALGCSLACSTRASAQSERFRGLWEGTIQAGRGDHGLALVVRPRGATGFTGMLYQDGNAMGVVESGRIAGDSLTFSLMGFDVAALATGDRLAGDFTVRYGSTHRFEMTRTSTDTTRVPAPRAAEQVPGASRITHEPPPDSVYRAHLVAPGTPASLAPCLARGTLLLVGGGPSQSDLDRRFVELAGGPDARIVLIPTAAVETADTGLAARFAAAVSRNMGLHHVTVLHTTSRREADSEVFVAPLRQATGVWILGGEGSWLIDSYLGTRTERELIAVLERGGVVGGTSAGAVIWASPMLTFQHKAHAEDPQPMKVENLLIGDLRGTGIGLLRNVTIAPHYTAFKLDAALRKLVDATPGLLGIGIDESTALEVHGDVGRVLGRGSVTLYPAGTAQPPVVLKDGNRYDLIRRQVL